MSHLAEKIETLTPQQAAAVEEFVELLLRRGQDRVLVQSAAGASEASFAAFWNNPEDDAYDAI
jgi:hypothetical protein